MIDCQEVKELLPLWVGQDLPDMTSAAHVADHLKTCENCERQRQSLQSSLDVLQVASSNTLLMKPLRPSVWPVLAVQVSNWDERHRRQSMSSWLPAAVMAVAVTLMVAVSIPSIYDEIVGNDPSLATSDQFEFDPKIGKYPKLPQFRVDDSVRVMPIGGPATPERPKKHQ